MPEPQLTSGHNVDPKRVGKKPLSICASCPWRTANHGKPHPSGWFKLSNIRRLWNGLRAGDAPGMICHSTDPKSPNYGGTAPIRPDSVPRECGGAVLLITLHCNEFSSLGGNMKAYRARHPRAALSRNAMAEYVWRSLTGSMLSVVGDPSEISVPGDATPTPIERDEPEDPSIDGYSKVVCKHDGIEPATPIHEEEAADAR